MQHNTFHSIALLLLCLAWANKAYGQDCLCRVRLDVDPVASTLRLSSLTRLNTISSAIEWQGNVTRGYQGILFACSPQPCPTTGSRSAWQSVQFTVSTAANQSLQVYPELNLGRTILGRSLRTWDYNTSGWQVSLNGTTAIGSPASVLWTTRLTQGYLSSNNALSGPRFDNIAPLSAVTTTPTSLTLSQVAGLNVTMLTLDVPVLNLTYTSTDKLNLSGIVYDSIAANTLTGRVVAKAVLACPRYCGDFGRCVVDANGMGLCVCDCGAPPDVDGQCSACGHVATSAPIPTPPPTAAPAPALAPVAQQAPSTQQGCVLSSNMQGNILPVNGACPEGYTLNTTNAFCSRCTSGLGGPDCAFCTSNGACATSLNSPGAQCLLGPSYAERSALKNYACTLQDPAISAILGSTINFQCSTTKPAPGAGVGVGSGGLVIGSLVSVPGGPMGATPYCDLRMRLDGMPQDAYVQCTGWDCAFTVNSSQVSCPTLRCACPNGCIDGVGTDWQPIFGSVQGAVDVGCAAGSGAQHQCTINVQGVGINPIPATCRTSECLDPKASISITRAAVEKKESNVSPPIISFVPIMAQLLLACACAAAAAALQPYLSPSTASRVSSIGLPLGTAAGPVAEGAEGPADASVIDQRGVQLWSQDKFDALAATGSLQATGKHSRAAAVTPEHVLLHLPSTENSVAGAMEGLGGACIQSLSWHGVSMEVPSRRSCLPWHKTDPPSRILSSICGQAQRGEVMAILGPSGSGKSSLLNVLAGNVSHGPQYSIQGRVCMDERAVHGSTLRRLVGHVPQFDLAMRSLTVEECLRVSAALRVSRNLSPAQVTERVHSLLEALQIEHLKARVVLTANASSSLLSGGERQRVSIACELVADPQVLLLDEPTSGLDAFGAHRLMDTLQCVAVAGRVVLCSLHQPSPGVFSSLQRVMLIAQGQRVYYGTPADAANAFGCMGVPCPSHLAIAEHMLYAVADPRVIQQLLAGNKQQGHMLPNQLVMPDQHTRGASHTSSDGNQLHPASKQQAVGPALLESSSTAKQPNVSTSSGACVPTAPEAKAGCGGSSSSSEGGQQDAIDLSPSRPSPVHKTAAGTSAVPMHEQSLQSAAGGISSASPPYLQDHSAVNPSSALAGIGRKGWFRQRWTEVGVLTWRSSLDMYRNPAQLWTHLAFGVLLGVLVGAVFYKVALTGGGAQSRLGCAFFIVSLLAVFGCTAVDSVFGERPVVERELLRACYGPGTYMLTKLLLDSLLLRVLPTAAFSIPIYWLMGWRPTAAAFFTFTGVLCTFAGLAGSACLGLSVLLPSPGQTVLAFNLLVLACTLFSGFLANKDIITPVLAWIVDISPVRYAWEVLVVNELKSLSFAIIQPDLPRVSLRGTVFLNILGVRSDRMDANLIILSCLWLLVVLGAVLLMVLRAGGAGRRMLPCGTYRQAAI